MATLDFGQQLAKRKRLITGLVLVALGLTVITVGGAYWWSVRKEKPVSLPRALSSDIHQQVSGYTFTRSDEGRRVFTIHAARTLAFKQGGANVLEDVFVEFFGQANDRHDILRTSRGEYNTQSGDFYSRGSVEIELNAPSDAPPGAENRTRQPIFLETSNVSFQHRDSVVVTEAPVRFRIGPASGSARGLTYAVRDGWLELKNQVAAELHPKESGQLPVQFAAVKARYEKKGGEIILWGPITLTQGKRRMAADRGTISLDRRNRLTRAMLEGSVRGSDSSPGRSLQFSASHMQSGFDPVSGRLQNLVAQGDVNGESRQAGGVSRLWAQKFEIEFRGAHPEPTTATSSGNAQLTLEPAVTPAPNGRPTQASADKKTLAADQVRFVFRSGGRSVQQAETFGPSKLTVIPIGAKGGQRVISAGQFTMAFDRQSRIESLRGLGGTQVVFDPPATAPPGSAPQETSSDRLEARFDPATGLLRAVEQAGDFRFREGDRQASSREARYISPPGTLTLTGRPEIWDTATRVRANRIVYNLDTSTAEGAGHVQGTHSEPAGQQGHREGQQPATVATNVLADRMVAARRNQFIHYQGHVRAWRGQDTIESESLDISRTERRLSSGYRVLTSYVQPASERAGPITSAARPPRSIGVRPVTIRADRLDYVDQGRKASYDGNVQLQAENTTLQADQLEVFFSEPGVGGPSEVQRAIAQGHVMVTQPARRASGEHADYDAGPGKIVLTGGPPTIYDEQKGVTTGERLTFYIRDDRLIVDGGNKSPTISKHRVAQ